MSYTNIKEIVMEAEAEAYINTCIKESVKICIAEDISVRLIHNGKEYLICFNDIINFIRGKE